MKIDIRQASGQGRAEITYYLLAPAQANPGGDYKLAYSPPYLPGRQSNPKVATSTARRSRADRPSMWIGTVRSTFCAFLLMF